jgi:serine O-acetyltransferase
VARIARIEPTLTTHTFRELMFSDILRFRPRSKPSWRGVLIALPAHPGVLASLFLRAQQVLVRRGRLRLAWCTRTLCNALTGADIAPGAHVGLGLMIVHPNGVCLGYGSNLGNNITMASGVVIGVRNLHEAEAAAGDDGAVLGDVGTIGDGVFFGAHAVVLGGVRVGNNAMIGANSVVLSDVPDDAVMLGVPARRVGTQPPPTDVPPAV